MIAEALPLLANHLWQSTLFAGAAGLLVLFLKRNRAAVRYVVWLAASVKFLLPFSLLITLGSQFEWPTERVEAPQALAYALEGFSQPFAVQPSVEPSVPSSANIGRTPLRERIPTLLFVVWFIGAVFVGLRWFVEWWRMRVSLRAAVLLEMKVPIRVLVTPSAVEPGVVGILRPALLLPRGLMDRLTPNNSMRSSCTNCVTSDGWTIWRRRCTCSSRWSSGFIHWSGGSSIVLSMNANGHATRTSSGEEARLRPTLKEF